MLSCNNMQVLSVALKNTSLASSSLRLLGKSKTKICIWMLLGSAMRRMDHQVTDTTAPPRRLHNGSGSKQVLSVGCAYSHGKPAGLSESYCTTLHATRSRHNEKQNQTLRRDSLSSCRFSLRFLFHVQCRLGLQKRCLR